MADVVRDVVLVVVAWGVIALLCALIIAQERSRRG